MSGKEAGLSGRTGIKICGLSRTCDIDHVNEAMPDYAGFILHFPKSHRNVTAQQARELIQRLKPGIRAVGVFVDQSLETVCGTAKTAGLDIIQLHGREDNAFILDVRERTGLPVWKAFRVRKAEDIGEAAACAADMVLLDNGYGTGEAFDWSIVSGTQALLQREFIDPGGGPSAASGSGRPFLRCGDGQAKRPRQDHRGCPCGAKLLELADTPDYRSCTPDRRSAESAAVILNGGIK